MNTSDGTSHKIRLAETPPVACASCYGQYVERRHVDFNASYDGPTLPPDSEKVAGGKYLTVDDLVICEECLSAAAALLGLKDESVLEADNDRLREINAEISEKLAGAMAYVQQLEAEQKARKQLLAALGTRGK